jgi:hypothetical protein
LEAWLANKGFTVAELECNRYAEGDEGAEECREAGDGGSTGERTGGRISESVATADTVGTGRASSLYFFP